LKEGNTIEFIISTILEYYSE